MTTKATSEHLPPELDDRWEPVRRGYQDITYHKWDGKARIAFDRPNVRNAFRPGTLDEMHEALRDAWNDTSIGAVLLSANGPADDGVWSFCSGGDQSIRETEGYGGDGEVPRLNVLPMQRTMRSMPIPVVALVPDYAIGGGHVLHVVADLTLAAEGARFGQTGPKVGSFDAGFGTATLIDQVGVKKAKEIWFLCREYTAEEAMDMGMVNEVVPREELEAEGVRWADEILEKSPLAIRAMKSAFSAALDGQAGLQQLAGNATRFFYHTEEAQEGRDAFNEDRDPDFREREYLP